MTLSGLILNVWTLVYMSVSLISDTSTLILRTDTHTDINDIDTQFTKIQILTIRAITYS